DLRHGGRRDRTLERGDHAGGLRGAPRDAAGLAAALDRRTAAARGRRGHGAGAKAAALWRGAALGAQIARLPLNAKMAPETLGILDRLGKDRCAAPGTTFCWSLLVAAPRLRRFRPP